MYIYPFQKSKILNMPYAHFWWKKMTLFKIISSDK